jgi:hypothetical protein
VTQKENERDASWDSKIARSAEAICHCIVDDANVAALGAKTFESGSAWFLRACYIPVFG